MPAQPSRMDLRSHLMPQDSGSLRMEGWERSSNFQADNGSESGGEFHRGSQYGRASESPRWQQRTTTAPRADDESFREAEGCKPLSSYPHYPQISGCGLPNPSSGCHAATSCPVPFASETEERSHQQNWLSKDTNVASPQLSPPQYPLDHQPQHKIDEKRAKYQQVQPQSSEGKDTGWWNCHPCCESWRRQDQGKDRHQMAHHSPMKSGYRETEGSRHHQQPYRSSPGTCCNMELIASAPQLSPNSYGTVQGVEQCYPTNYHLSQEQQHLSYAAHAPHISPGGLAHQDGLAPMRGSHAGRVPRHIMANTVSPCELPSLDSVGFCEGVSSLQSSPNASSSAQSSPLDVQNPGYLQPTWQQQEYLSQCTSSPLIPEFFSERDSNSGRHAPQYCQPGSASAWAKAKPQHSEDSFQNYFQNQQSPASEHVPSSTQAAYCCQIYGQYNHVQQPTGMFSQNIPITREDEEDLSKLVDQVLDSLEAEEVSCQSGEMTDPPHYYVGREGQEALCHNCGTMIFLKPDESCYNCGVSISLDYLSQEESEKVREEGATSLMAPQDLSSTSRTKNSLENLEHQEGSKEKTNCHPEEYLRSLPTGGGPTCSATREKSPIHEEASDEANIKNYIFGQSNSSPCPVTCCTTLKTRHQKQRTVGVVEPRVVAKIQAVKPAEKTSTANDDESGSSHHAQSKKRPAFEGTCSLKRFKPDLQVQEQLDFPTPSGDGLRRSQGDSAADKFAQGATGGPLTSKAPLHGHCNVACHPAVAYNKAQPENADRKQGHNRSSSCCCSSDISTVKNSISSGFLHSNNNGLASSFAGSCCCCPSSIDINHVCDRKNNNFKADEADSGLRTCSSEFESGSPVLNGVETTRLVKKVNGPRKCLHHDDGDPTFMSSAAENRNGGDDHVSSSSSSCPRVEGCDGEIKPGSDRCEMASKCKKSDSGDKVEFVEGFEPESPGQSSQGRPAADARKVKQNKGVFKVRISVDSAKDDRWLFCPERGCTFWTRKPLRMERHTTCHMKDAKYFKCPDCPLRFYSLAKMLKHDRKVHTGVKDYECRICEAEVTDIQVHMRIHKAEKQFECPTCPMQFRHKNSLVRHLCQHTGERPFNCRACSSSFISLHRMKEHLKKCHPGIPTDPDQEKCTPQSPDDEVSEEMRPPSENAGIQECVITCPTTNQQPTKKFQDTNAEEKPAMISKELRPPDQQEQQQLSQQATLAVPVMALVRGLDGATYLVPHSQPATISPAQPLVIEKSLTSVSTPAYSLVVQQPLVAHGSVRFLTTSNYHQPVINAASCSGIASVGLKLYTSAIGQGVGKCLALRDDSPTTSPSIAMASSTGILQYYSPNSSGSSTCL